MSCVTRRSKRLSEKSNNVPVSSIVEKSKASTTASRRSPVHKRRLLSPIENIPKVADNLEKCRNSTVNKMKRSVPPTTLKPVEVKEENETTKDEPMIKEELVTIKEAPVVIKEEPKEEANQSIGKIKRRGSDRKNSSSKDKQEHSLKVTRSGRSFSPYEFAIFSNRGLAAFFSGPSNQLIAAPTISSAKMKPLATSTPLPGRKVGRPRRKIEPLNRADPKLPLLVTPELTREPLTNKPKGESVLPLIKEEDIKKEKIEENGASYSSTDCLNNKGIGNERSEESWAPTSSQPEVDLFAEENIPTFLRDFPTRPIRDENQMYKLVYHAPTEEMKNLAKFTFQYDMNNRFPKLPDQLLYNPNLSKIMFCDTSKYEFKSVFKDRDTVISSFYEYAGLIIPKSGPVGKYDIEETVSLESRRFYRKKITDSGLNAWYRYNVAACSKQNSVELIEHQHQHYHTRRRVALHPDFYEAEYIWKLNMTHRLPTVDEVLGL